MHAWRFAGEDTIGSLPILDILTGSTRVGPLVPAANFAEAYLLLALLLLGARWVTRPVDPE
jgi:hypothetical protein